MKNILFFMLMLTSFLACTKQEGLGGDASITGKVWTRHYNSTFTTFIGEYPATDQYVYIIFGDDLSYGQRLKTDYEGDFEFKHLYPGDYRIYCYSLDSTLTDLSGKVPVIKDIHINSRSEHADAGTLIIYQ